MKGVRLRTLMIFMLAALAGVALLHTSQRVQESEESLAQLKADVEREQDTIRMLRAEWEYLNRPERLERLAAEFLDLVPPVPTEMNQKLRDDLTSLPEKELIGEALMEAQPVQYNGEVP